MAQFLLETLPLRPAHSSRLLPCPSAAIHSSSTCSLGRQASRPYQSCTPFGRRPLSRWAPACQVAVLDEPQVGNTPEEDSAPAAESTEEASLDDLYSQFDTLLVDGGREFEAGDMIMGVVTHTDKRGAYVDVGGKMSAFVQTEDITLGPLQKASQILAPGMRRQFMVVTKRMDDASYLSIKNLELDLVWERAKQMADLKAVVPVTVDSQQRAGFLCSFQDLPTLTAFMPASHSPETDIVGKKIDVKIIDCLKENNRLIVSNRAVRSSSSVVRSCKVGQVLEAVIRSIQPYGAFLELDGNFTGLLHISNVSQDRVSRMDSVMNVGDKIKAMVIMNENDGTRVSLSTKALEPQPGDMLKNPGLVYEKAEEMAALFRERAQQATTASQDDPFASQDSTSESVDS
ncbi:hypothetical protein WJX84_010105 [Apatococcus fuscideae]|uniref:S1 motif domain-containing protein n=1 Tax=Apatococcus fuscideae TaxID=2026836 RepID=A0AAW1TGV4_9CHLO